MNKKKTNSKVKKSPKRIIICSVVDLAPEWMFSCKEDVCFIYHGKDPRIKNKLRENSEYLVFHKDHKISNYKLAIQECDLQEKYDEFTFIDDDLIVSAETLTVCFDNLDKYNLDICQPSVTTDDNFVEWPHLLKKPDIVWEKTNIIDCGYMCMSKDFLSKLIPHMADSKSHSIFSYIFHLFSKEIGLFHDISYFKQKKTVKTLSVFFANTKRRILYVIPRFIYIPFSRYRYQSLSRKKQLAFSAIEEYLKAIEPNISFPLAPTSHSQEKRNLPKILSNKDDLIAITTYFNPSGYNSKKKNYDIFFEKLKSQGVKLITVECAQEKELYELKQGDADYLIQVKSESVLWQKERLMNIAMVSVPKKYTKVCWLDCDVLFQNDLWAKETSYLLDSNNIVQPFSYSYRLKCDEFFVKKDKYTYGFKDGEQFHGFVYAMKQLGGQKPGFWLGHTGFAWACRRDCLDWFYDGLIFGGGDHLMAYAFYGYHAGGIKSKSSRAMVRHQKSWVEKTSNRVGGKIDYVNGTIVHLWHGSRENRQHEERMGIFKQINFNPEKDLSLGVGGCWIVNDKIEAVAVKFFEDRKED